MVAFIHVIMLVSAALFFTIIAQRRCFKSLRCAGAPVGFLLLKGNSLPALSHRLSSDDEINLEGFSCQPNRGRKQRAGSCVFKPRASQLLTDGEVNKQAERTRLPQSEC